MDHKFMVFGHSYLPNDAEFDMTETPSRKTQYVYVSGDYKETTMNANRICPKFDVIEIKNSD